MELFQEAVNVALTFDVALAMKAGTSSFSLFFLGCVGLDGVPS